MMNGDALVLDGIHWPHGSQVAKISRDVQRAMYSASGMVEARCANLLTRNEGDVLDNYRLPDTQAYLYKPHPLMISNTKDRDLLEKFLRDKKHQPGPTSYPLTHWGRKMHPSTKQSRSPSYMRSRRNQS
jgi:hypothetical protein